MIEIRKLQEGDIDRIIDSALEQGLENYPNLLTPSEHCYTALLDGKVVAVGGIVVFWKGVGEGWVLFSKDVLKIRSEIASALKSMYEKISQNGDFIRIQCVIRKDFPQAQKMVEKLGFKEEGTLRKYLPDGSDGIMYAYVKE